MWKTKGKRNNNFPEMIKTNIGDICTIMKIKKLLKIIAVALSATFFVLMIFAKKTKKNSIFANLYAEKNPMEGKKVIFVEDENDEENADGARGHLEAVGETSYHPGFYDKYVKRAIDIVLSFGGLVVLSPIFAIIALAIKIEDPGPVLFTQKRIGQDKQYFKLYKFRSMKVSTPHDVPTHMLDNPDQYITKVGKFIRAHSLDELPQIWDIFVGNMSVIGPRPALWNQDILVAERDKYGANDVKPGLTGWAQINGRDELEIPVKAKLDGEYVQKESLLFDIKCFLGTVMKVAKDDSVVEGGTGEMKKEKKTKKILVVCQYYYPEPFRITDICEELVKRGYEVQVVTGYPNYPEGVLYEGYGRGKNIDEIINGVKVHRCFTIPRKNGAIYRLLNYYSYAISSKRYVLSKKCAASDGTPFDIVFCNQLSPVMMANAAIAYKKKHKVPSVMYCLDLWPESLIAGGIDRGSMIYKYFSGVSKRIYKSMDKILVTSRMFTDYLAENFGLDYSSIDYLPQYAEQLFDCIEYHEEGERFNLTFAGNIGFTQSVMTVLKAAELLRDYPVIFNIVGSGTDLEELKRFKAEKSLDNIIFYGRKPLEEMPKFYEEADAMLVTLQADPVLSKTLPGKVQSYMAAGKPIIGAIDGETSNVINEAKCGFCGKAEDYVELSENIKKFIGSCNRKEMGVNARNYYEKHFKKDVFMDKLEKVLSDTASL